MVEQRRHRVGCQVLLVVVQREWLDEQHRAAGFEMLPRVPCGADRIAHVVQAVEEADEVEAAGVLVGGHGLEHDPVGYAGLLGPLARGGDRRLVEVEPPEPGAGERLCHDDSGGAVTAADIGDPGAGGQLGADVIQGRDPVAKVSPVSGAEQPLGALEQPPVMFFPAHRPGRAKDRCQLVEVGIERAHRVHRPCGEHRGRVIGQRQHSLRAQAVGAGRRVVHEQAGSRLSVQPLRYQPWIAAGSRGDFGWPCRAALGERPVQAKFVTEPDSVAHGGARHEADHALHELLEPFFPGNRRHGRPLLADLCGSSRPDQRRSGLEDPRPPHMGTSPCWCAGGL